MKLEFYRSGLGRRSPLAPISLQREKVGASAQGRGFSRRVDAVGNAELVLGGTIVGLGKPVMQGRPDIDQVVDA